TARGCAQPTRRSLPPRQTQASATTRARSRAARSLDARACGRARDGRERPSAYFARSAVIGICDVTSPQMPANLPDASFEILMNARLLPRSAVRINPFGDVNTSRIGNVLPSWLTAEPVYAPGLPEI